MEEDVGNIPITIDPVRGSLPAVGHDVCGYRPTPTEELSEQVQSSGSLSGSRTSSPSHLEELGVQLYSGPKNPDMGPIDTRKASFVDKEWPENTPVSTDRLAEAGFYYIGNIFQLDNLFFIRILN